MQYMKQFISFFLIIFIVGCNKNSSNDSAAAFNNNGQGGSLARFTIAGNYLYTVDKENLKVFDITNAAQPVFRTTVPAGFEIETIFPFNDKLFIGSTSVVHIFSIADPAHPQKQGEAISPNVMRRCDPVVAKDTVAYATLRTNGPCGGTASILSVFDIKDVSHPVQKAAVPVSEPYGLGYSGNTLYVCDKMQGLMVFDISQAYNPVFKRSLTVTGSSFIDVIPFNNTLVCWVTDGMVLYDISNPQNPVLITQIH